MTKRCITCWILCLSLWLCTAARPLPAPAAHLQKQAGELHLKTAVAAFHQGKTAAAAGRRGEAEADFQHAIDIEPTYLDAYHALIRLYLGEHRPEEAGTAMTRLLQIDPRDTTVRMQLARLLEEEKQWMAALAQYSLLLDGRPQDRWILYHFAVCAGQAHLAEQARTAVKRGLALDPADRQFLQLDRQLNAATSTGEAKRQPEGMNKP